MSVGGIYTQLVLFDATNMNDQQWSNKIETLSKLPSTCTFCIFCNDQNTIVEQTLPSGINSQIELNKSNDPIVEMFDILYNMRFTCSYILIVSDKNASYARNLSKISKKHKNICVIPMDPSNINLTDIIGKVNAEKTKESINATNYLQGRCENKDASQLYSSGDQPDHLKKISDNKKNRLGTQYTGDLSCLVCKKLFHNRDDQNKHIKAGHPDATSDDDDFEDII